MAARDQASRHQSIFATRRREVKQTLGQTIACAIVRPIQRLICGDIGRFGTSVSEPSGPIDLWPRSLHGWAIDLPAVVIYRRRKVMSSSISPGSLDGNPPPRRGAPGEDLVDPAHGSASAGSNGEPGMRTKAQS
jgi:hypothetical protein